MNNNNKKKKGFVVVVAFFDLWTNLIEIDLNQGYKYINNNGNKNQ